MASTHNFEHLPLVLRYQGRARLRSGGSLSPQTVANRKAWQAHSMALRSAAQSVSTNWQARNTMRQEQNLPVIPKGVPVLLQVDPGLDLEVLRAKYAFEIVAEQEEGYVIVASEEIDLSTFVRMVNAFAVQIHGSATVASIHKLFDDPTQADRLRRILSDQLFESWAKVSDSQPYIVDIGIACMGTQEIPTRPDRGERPMDARWARKERDWLQARAAAYAAWDEIKANREDEINDFFAFYQSEILHFIDGAPYDAAVLPDSFTIRVKVNGKGLKDFILNYPYIFEVIEPEDIALPQCAGEAGAQPAQVPVPTPPSPNAPAVCIIDSGVQEGHTLLQPAIDQAASHCFLPGETPGNVGDFVSPAGHGTRGSTVRLSHETVRLSFHSGFRTPAYSTSTTACPCSCSLRRRFVLPSSGFTGDPGKHGYSITPSIPLVTVVRGTCRHGQRKSTLFVPHTTCLLSRARAICQKMESCHIWV